VDLVTEEPLTNREMRRLAAQMSDWLQAVGSDGIEGRDAQDTFSHGHTHVSTEDMACSTCSALSRDERR
jgi:hypothetical protein